MPIVVARLAGQWCRDIIVRNLAWLDGEQAGQLKCSTDDSYLVRIARKSIFKKPVEQVRQVPISDSYRLRPPHRESGERVAPFSLVKTRPHPEPTLQPVDYYTKALL